MGSVVCSHAAPLPSLSPALLLPLQLWLEGKREKRQKSFLLNALNEVRVPVLENYICCFFFILNFKFIYFWLHWIFVAVCGERGLLFVVVRGL